MFDRFISVLPKVIVQAAASEGIFVVAFRKSNPKYDWANEYSLNYSAW